MPERVPTPLLDAGTADESPLAAQVEQLVHPRPISTAPIPTDKVLVVRNDTGEEEWVDPEEATAAFKAGAVNLPRDRHVGIADPESGDLRVTTPEQVSDAIARGGALVPTPEAHHAELTREYGGLKGAAIAGAAGIGRGATFGLSDAAIRAFGGPEAAEAEAASHEAHPFVAGAGEVGGLALGSMLLPGAAVEEGVGGALARASGGAVAKGAATLGGRVTARALALGARGVVEGAGGGLAQTISEHVLNDGNHALTGEQLVAGVGHGAIVGGIFGMLAGGGIEAVKTGARSIMGAAGESPRLQTLANREMWRDLNSAQGITKQAMRRVEGGTEALGETARAIGLDDPRLSVEEQLSKAIEAKEATGAEIGDFYRRSGASAEPRALIDRLDKMIARVDETAGTEGTVNALKQYRASLIEKLGRDAMEGGEEAGAAVVLDPRHQALLDEIDRLRAAGMPEDQIKRAEDFAAQAFGPRPSAAAPKEILDRPVSLEDLWKQRRGLDRVVYQETKALDPKLRVEVLREFRGQFNDFLEETGEKAAPGEFRDGIRALNTRYQHLSLINDTLEVKAARALTNRRFSLTDTIMQGGGTAGAATALMAGHPLVAAGSLAMGLGNKLLRERGPRLAAWLLGRVGGLENLASHVGAMDGAIKRTATAIVERSAPAESGVFRVAPERAVASKDHADDVRTEYEASVDMVRQLADHPEIGAATRAHFDDLAQHAPETAAAAAMTAKRGIDYLAQHIPPSIAVDPLRPEATTPPSLGVMSRWLRRRDAVNDPGLLFEQARSLRIDPITLDAVRNVYPESVTKLGTTIGARVAEDPTKLDRSARLALSPIVGSALTSSARAETVTRRQAVFAVAAQAPPAPPRPQSSSSKRMGDAYPLATTTERLAKGE